MSPIQRSRKRRISPIVRPSKSTLIRCPEFSSRPAADGRARYVLSVTPVSRTVTVGPAEDLDVDEVIGIRPRWTGRPPDGEVRALAQVRAHGEAVPATVAADDGEVRVLLDRPLRAVAPGQAVVLYDGTRVLGSATVAAARRR